MAKTIAAMKLKYVAITSVYRDDLRDAGALELSGRSAGARGRLRDIVFALYAGIENRRFQQLPFAAVSRS
jgi:hypothetical protein